MDDAGAASSEEAPRAIKPTSKEFRKTWGFRRTTIAKREGVGDVEADAGEPAPSLRRSGRQPKRTERVEEFLTTVRRRGRRGEPASCPATDGETASEGSVESASEVKGGGQAEPGSVAAEKAKARDGEDDTSDSDSDGLTLKELQNRLRRQREQEPPERPLRGTPNRLRKPQREEDPTEAGAVEADSAAEQGLPSQEEPEMAHGEASQVAEEDPESEAEGPVARGAGEERGAMGRPQPECEMYDPSALYCICRQPHNNRWVDAGLAWAGGLRAWAAAALAALFPDTVHAAASRLPWGCWRGTHC